MKIILDVDTGTDDAVAIMMAALHPSIELVACTVVQGNSYLEDCTDNTLRVLAHVGHSEIPVYAGAHRPLARHDLPTPRDPLNPKALHGRILPLEPSDVGPQLQHAANFLVDYFRTDVDETVLVAVGPLTNLAMACLLAPDFVKRVRRLVIMGGGHAIANWSPTSEFNFWADAEAASVIMSAGFADVTLVTLDATHEALVTREDCDLLDDAATPAATVASGFIRKRIDVHDANEQMSVPHSAPVHDALCVGLLVDPEIVRLTSLHVQVETTSHGAIGQSIIDVHKRGDKPPNCKVGLSSDRRRFFDLMLNTLGGRLS